MFTMVWEKICTFGRLKKSNWFIANLLYKQLPFCIDCGRGCVCSYVRARVCEWIYTMKQCKRSELLTWVLTFCRLY